MILNSFDDKAAVPAIVDDVNKALHAEAYFAALGLALTLPDICGKVAYPSEGTGERYRRWYRDCLGRSEMPSGDVECCSCLSDVVVYQLRCAFLHEGSNKIKAIQDFTFIIEPENEFEFYMDAASSSMHYNSYCVNIRRLCFLLTRCAIAYYKQNKEKFDAVLKCWEASCVDD